MKPKVSIVMPVLNGERYIGEGIRSILNQTYDNYELVLVDDGSTDRTREVVDSFHDMLDVKYIYHPAPKGIAPSMNDGVCHASGQLISFLDHDDAWFPDFLETQVTYLLHHPDVAMVHSDFQTIDSDGSVIEESVATSRRRIRPSGHVFHQLFLDSFIVGNSVMIRRECLEGLFDESLRWGDYHMWMRIARHHKVDYVPKVLTQYRQHNTQSTQTAPAVGTNQEPVGLLAIKKILEQYPEIRKELGDREVRRRMAQLYFDMAYFWFFKGSFRNARSCVANAIRLSPSDGRYYVLYAASLLRPSRAMALRAGWHWVRGLMSPAD